MRVNPNTPYQPLTHQQLHEEQSTLSQRHHQPPHQLNNAFQQPTTSQVPTQTATANANISHLPGVFNSSSQQQNSWTTQQQTSYLQSTKPMLPSTQPPPPSSATAGTMNSWPQQMPQVQQSFQNAAIQQQHQQQQKQGPPNPNQISNYNNYYHQPKQQQQPANNSLYSKQSQQQQQQPAPNQEQITHQNPAMYFPQQSAQATQYKTNPVNFFDQANNNNNNNSNQAVSTEGWGDWDWNDNSTISTQPSSESINVKTESNIQAVQQSQHPSHHQQQASCNNSLLAESFSAQNNSDSWNWGSNENEQQVSRKELQDSGNWNWNNPANEKEKTLQGPQPKGQGQHNDNWNWQTPNENHQHALKVQNLTEVTKIAPNSSEKVSSQVSPPPPPAEFSTSVSENHNYNTNTSAGTSPNNIPNTVFLTQAKPVTLPPRQYASPPGGSTPITESPSLDTALMPPQGFENLEESYQTTVGHSFPPVAAPLPAVLPPATNKFSSNPFKRSGAAQRHRATGLISTTTPSVAGQPPELAAFNMPPPPPADFANPVAVALMEPDNNELPSQENQEVLTPPTPHITLPNATVQPSTAISLTHNTLTQAVPPPNDERNQYLQTSHLSENSEEQQPEIDGLLPPPGLSRLVLGEPELEASQQRMVMGTEATNSNNAVTQAAVMHLEERHADGEDTASENALPVTSSIGQGVPPNTSTMSSDRNLYMVPGESNTGNNQQQQRVVTGVELAEQREIEMDGENLEDDQHHHLQSQHQHQHSTLSADARNEPPVEGADDTVVTAPPALAPIITSHATEAHLDHQHHHSVNQLATKMKDSNPISSPNDDDDSDERLLNDRGMNQSTAGSSKSRTKYENESLANVTRRRDKRSSAERYESDEYLNSECEYSSERDERERERRRNYRETSVRSDRGVKEDDDKRSRRYRASNRRDKYYYEGEERRRGSRDDGGREHERDRDRDREPERSKVERRSQRQRGYDADSRYETEESTRFDSRKDPLKPRSARRNGRSDPAADYDDYIRRGNYRSSKRAADNYESDRRERRRSDKHREPRYRDDPRCYDPREYEDYRKHSSRNARESDVEKEVPGTARSSRLHHDARHAAMYGYPTGGYYDPYTAYYYQQMARTNPQAYAEWYKKYYGQAAANVAQQSAPSNASQADSSMPAAGNDGRESVHSGRSSAHNDVKDRYTHAYITQANDYHRHYQQHLHQHQHQHYHQQQHQQQLAYNQSLNSTMLDEENPNLNTSLYSGLGNLSLVRSNTNLSQIHNSYYMPAASATASSGAYYARSDYAESRSGALSVHDAKSMVQEPQRLTPCKFVTEHTVVNFASGILVTVKPKYTTNGNISNIVKLLKFKPNDETRKLFKVFPGPLVRGLSHKKTLIEFCQEQIRLGPMDTSIYAKQLMINNNEKYRGSYTLMWNLLILLLKQNGMVVGTDIAELLLKNQQQFPYQTPVSTANMSLESKSGSNSPIPLHIDSLKNPQPPAYVEPESLIEAQDKTKNNEEQEQEEQEDSEENLLAKSMNNSVSLSETEITEKFRNYLLYGNVNEALEWATDNNLWGHALFLASKLDRRTHANVMMKFANKLSLNDPLQTLYQLMSGRTPSSVTCVQDDKWGDWRPHLSMILSNTSQKPELDRKAITTLGDSLFNRGDLYAAHFCYLMAQVGFGRYQTSAIQETSLQQHLPKLVLLGSSHYKQFKDFAHNEAIIMTEIYEYACSLNDEKFSIIEFQPYKYLLATRLLDYGYHLKSLMYLEQTAEHIARQPSKYESSFINKVYEMADRLKYYDPVLEKTIDDQQPNSDDNNGLDLLTQQTEEQQWLQNLRQLVQQQQQEQQQQRKTDCINESTTLTTILPEGQQHDPLYYNQQQQQIDQQFMEINKQFSELNLQYQQQTTGNIEQQQQQQQQHQASTAYYNAGQQQQVQELIATNIYQQQQQPSLQTEQLSNQKANDLTSSSVDAQLGDNLQQQFPYVSNEIMQPTSGYSNNYYDPTHYSETGGNILENQQTTSVNYDYWQQQQQQQAVTQLTDENARPTITMPKSKTYDTDEENLARTLQQQQQQQYQQTANEGNRKQLQTQQPQQRAVKKDEANRNQQQPASQNSGWFGGIWNKFSLKPKNQMILPDDKNPSIVWDAEKKKWVNTDGDENEEEALKPPPKMTDLMPQQQQQQQIQTNQIPFTDGQQMQSQPQQQQYVPNSITPQSAPSPSPLQQEQNPNQSQSPHMPAPAKTPTLQSNMFKMQRNRTLKNAYVDVFNPSGAPVNRAAENILAPALPPATVPQGGFFIPGSQPSTAAGAGNNQELNYQQQQQQQQQQPQQQNTPQFYNPNQFTSSSGY